MSSSGLLLGAGGLLMLVTGVVYWVRKRLKASDTSSLYNKVIVITGASSGLGEACTKAFYRAGCKVVLCARRKEELDRVKQILKAIKMKQGCPVNEPKIMVLDIEDFNSMPGKVEKIIAFHGSVDILVNNAGISNRGDVLSTELDVFIKLMNVNYIGQVAITKAVLPHMIQQRSGHIVTISSIQGKIATPYRSAYTASKHAIQAFSDTLRSEVNEHNIHVSVISPGYIQTNLSLNALTASGTKYGVTDSTTSQGMPAADVATKIVQTVCQKDNEVLLAQTSHKLAVYLRNILPDLFFTIMNSRAKKQKKDYLKNK